ncbi:hypothetical protein GGQ68_000843 [Sagittula marina]|uniref:Uncharacterized protein n=1 Tax=Sagittula marina TaxID=943940 RepID=A0A7W6GRB8_9RHOB|nr:DUF6524 family protein [Sagittula marina]MBB3984527.1 hypothetical protein [Sagittula marina]
MSFFLRWLFAFLLLAATYNPTDWNYVRGAQAYWGQTPSVVTLVGLLLLAGYVIYLRATFRSIGPGGVIFVLALFGALLWVASDFGLISISDPGLATWVAILAGSLVLGIGMSWSIIRRAISGQVDTDDVEE